MTKKISQKKIIEYVLLSAGLILFIFVLQFVLVLVPPFVISVSPKEYKKGDTIRITGIALSGTNNPTEVYINEDAVAAKHIKNNNFFVLDFELTESIGAGYLRLKRGSIFSFPHLLVEKEDRDRSLVTAVQNGREFQFDLRYLPNIDTTEDPFSDENRISIEPLEPVVFGLNDIYMLKNLCTVRLRSNITDIRLRPYMWTKENDTQFSLVFDDLYWFNYQNSSNLAITFQCPEQKILSFPLDFASPLRISRDFSSWYELRAEFSSRQQGNTFMLPVQSRTQRRNILGIDLEEDEKTFNFLRTFRFYSGIEMQLSVVPVRILNPQILTFVKDSSTTQIPRYLELESNEKEDLDNLGNSELEVFRSLINLYDANTRIGVLEMKSILSALQDGLSQIDEEEDVFLDLATRSDQELMVYLMARMLRRYGILARTMATAKVGTADSKGLIVPIQYDDDVQFYLELFSVDFGWLIIDSQTLLPIKSKNGGQNNTEAESISEIAVPSNILKLYIAEELYWLETQSQKVVLPRLLQFL